jgi:hypothetical protein
MTDRPKVSEKDPRAQRLEAALRENLKRRKAQVRGRAEKENRAEPHDSAGITGEKDTG